MSRRRVLAAVSEGAFVVGVLVGAAYAAALAVAAVLTRLFPLEGVM